MSDKHVEIAEEQEPAATKPAKEERIMIKTIDPARQEGESFEDYKKRRAATNKLLKNRLRGAFISSEDYPKHLAKVREMKQIESFAKKMKKDTK